MVAVREANLQTAIFRDVPMDHLHHWNDHLLGLASKASTRDPMSKGAGLRGHSQVRDVDRLVGKNARNGFQHEQGERGGENKNFRSTGTK